MPGMPFLQLEPSYQGVTGEGVPSAASAAAGSHTMFLVWLVVLGVIVPALVLGGLRAGGFQFVYRRR